MIAMSFLGLLARLIILKFQVSFPVRKYFKDVLLRITYVAVLSIPIPLVMLYYIDGPVIQFFSVLITTVLSTTIGIWMVGINKAEKVFITNKIDQLKNKIIK